MTHEPTEQHPFTVATLNTQYGKALSSPQATDVLEGSDIALLQEVLRINPTETHKNLGAAGLHFAAFYPRSGLAIAISERFRTLHSDYAPLERQSRMAGPARAIGQHERFRERAMITLLLQDTETGRAITAATAHPVVAVRHAARTRQIQAATEFINSRHATGALVLGADMNHYPGAQKVDKQLAQKTRLRSVSNTEPTCLLQDTRHGWLQRLGLPDGRLDSLLFRGLVELSSETFQAESDHRGIRAQFAFAPK
jgi:hypothetical protein